ncbi:hypothetical protein [Chitinophaga pinensis]|uniref:hypothetical protein n=1 Tax=Chitinophaga pinensis TaxID=79329 RepID=UPI00019E368B|nr:hypothetical protein [Chitinophaga pinensis]
MLLHQLVNITGVHRQPFDRQGTNKTSRIFTSLFLSFLMTIASMYRGFSPAKL